VERTGKGSAEMQLWLEEPTAEWSWDRLWDASHIALARLKLNVDFIDIGKQYSPLVENGVLNYVNKFVDAPDATLTLTKDTLDSIPLKQITMDQAIKSGAIKIDGNKEAFTDFLGLLDTYSFWSTS
jgi:alkyl sulfatase BDS1-like metallo-beta-lactamase superfamily hydrolase